VGHHGKDLRCACVPTPSRPIRATCKSVFLVAEGNLAGPSARTWIGRPSSSQDPWPRNLHPLSTTIDPSRFLITDSASLIISSIMLAALISRLV
jgi:hypothetical protein